MIIYLWDKFWLYVPYWPLNHSSFPSLLHGGFTSIYHLLSIMNIIFNVKQNGFIFQKGEKSVISHFENSYF